MRSQIGGPKAMPPVDFRRVWGGLHSVAKQASFYVAFGIDFPGFWKPNGLPNSIFDAFFSTLYFIAFEHPILVDVSSLRTRKIAILPRENNDFCKIGVFDKSMKIA